MLAGHSMSRVLRTLYCCGLITLAFSASKSTADSSKSSWDPISDAGNVFNKTFGLLSRKTPDEIGSLLKKNSLPGIKHRIITDVAFGGHKLAEIFEDAKGNALDCNLLGDRDLIEAALNFIPNSLVTKVKEDEMHYFIDKCFNRTQEETKFKSIFTYISKIFKSLLIFPGTKWCGAGNVARNYDDLGYLNTTDFCCRNHDHSHDRIKAFQEKYSIRNKRFYTMTHCLDDRTFYYCLLNDMSIASATVGKMFFNILQTTCFIKTYPKKCVRNKWFYIPLLTNKCQEYELDRTTDRIWQIFKPPNFLKDYIARKQ